MIENVKENSQRGELRDRIIETAFGAFYCTWYQKYYDGRHCCVLKYIETYTL